MKIEDYDNEVRQLSEKEIERLMKNDYSAWYCYSYNQYDIYLDPVRRVYFVGYEGRVDYANLKKSELLNLFSRSGDDMLEIMEEVSHS